MARMKAATRNHRHWTRRARRVTLAACFAVAATVASAATPTRSLEGTVRDASLRPVPGVSVTVAATEGEIKRSTVSGADGVYRFDPLPAGEYRLSASFPAFKTFTSTVRTDGQSGVTRDVSLELGSLREEINVRYNPNAVAPVTQGARAGSADPMARATAGAASCVAGPEGGRVLEPRKLRDVRPVYGAELGSAGIAGVVVLHATITEEGDVAALVVDRTDHPALVEPASTAVLQWKYSPTYLNCDAVAVSMTVTVRFGL